jgi:hypothetical protein
VPAEQVGQHAAEQHADAPAARHAEAEDAEGLRPLADLGEEGHDQRQGDGGDDRAANALDGAGRDQQPLSRRHAARDRRRGEDRDAGQEQLPLAEQVAQPAAEQQEAAEGEQVGVHDPGERGLGEPEVVADRGQGDVHDRHVDDDHQVAQAEHVEGEPAGAFVGDGHVGLLILAV